MNGHILEKRICVLLEPTGYLVVHIANFNIGGTGFKKVSWENKTKSLEWDLFCFNETLFKTNTTIVGW